MIDEIPLYNQPVVIDNGSAVVKAGFCGEEKPRCMEYSLIGDANYNKIMVGGLECDSFYFNIDENVGKKQEGRVNQSTKYI